MSINFLLQATRILHIGNYDETEIRMIYDYVRTIDNETLNEYLDKKSILSYENDLEFYIELVDEVINIFEQREEYEKCSILKNKKEESIKIKLNKI
jgi:hypothetical protein